MRRSLTFAAGLLGTLALPLTALADLQKTAIDDAQGRAAVTLDLWDLPAGDPRVDALRQRNVTQSAAVLP